MDRQIIYPGQIPLETDLLNTNKYTMIAVAKLAAAMLGTATVVNGLACVPTGPASLQVVVNPGEMYSLVNVDGTAYSSIAADTTHSVLKQGISMDAVTLNCPAPVTGGQSVNYLIQATYQDSDTGLVTLPYYNASNPAQAWSGPNNSGAQQATARKGIVTISAKAGVAATTGSQTTPAADAGYTGLWVVTVANGQTQITAPNIVQATNAPILPASLLQSLQNGAANYAVDTGAANALVAALQPGITALKAGMEVRVKVANTNTSAATLNLNALGAIAITHADGTALLDGELQAGEIASLRYDGTNFQFSPRTGRLINVQVFTASGTYTPTSGTKSVVVEMAGGGGSGGATAATAGGQAAAGAGGGSGAYAKARFTTGFSGVAVTVGAGGAAPASGSNNGNAGGTSSFGALVSCPGGNPGNFGIVLSGPGQPSSNGGNTAAPSGANILGMAGQAGANGIVVAAGFPLAGSGGSSPLGIGGHYPTGSGARSGSGYGAGSSGVNAPASTAAQAGVAAQPGVVIVYEFA